jgi:lysophospholipase L1-like esterase
MRNHLIRKANSNTGAVISCLLVVIFVLAMKIPKKTGVSEKARKYTLLSLGDSYTIGEKVAPAQNFPNQVVRILSEKGIIFRPPEIVAKTGWTTDELQAAMKKARLKKTYDFVTLLIGVNNQYRGRKVVDYVPQFEALLKQAIQYAGNDSSRVVVLSIPDWSVTPFAADRDRKEITKSIDEYNAANKLIAGKYGVEYIYITSSTRKAETDPSLLASDGLHPSGKEYTGWAELVAEFIKKKI